MTSSTGFSALRRQSARRDPRRHRGRRVGAGRTTRPRRVARAQDHRRRRPRGLGSARAHRRPPDPGPHPDRVPGARSTPAPTNCACGSGRCVAVSPMSPARRRTCRPGSWRSPKKAVYVGTADEVVALTWVVPPGKSKCSPPTGRAALAWSPGRCSDERGTARQPEAARQVSRSGARGRPRRGAGGARARCVRQPAAPVNAARAWPVGRDAALATELTYGTLRARGLSTR